VNLPERVVHIVDVAKYTRPKMPICNHKMVTV